MMKKWYLVPVLSVSILATLLAGAASAQTQGLFGEYFSTTRMTGLALTRVDPQVNFTWGQGSPDPGVAENNFSVCWTGFVTPVQGGVYTFYVTADDGIRLWVDDVLLVNQWKAQGATEYSGTATLTAGTPHAIRVEYFESGGDALVKLEWEGPGEVRAAIPSARLTPGTGLNDRLLDWHINPANGHYYRIIGPGLTWAEGKAMAASMGGYLAVIDDAAEDTWLMGMFRPVSDTAFVGANDIAEEGVWVWDETGVNFWNGAADGTAVSGLYASWNTGEPNNVGETGEDVAELHLGTGLWNDLNAARERYCIVESGIAQIGYDGPTPGTAVLELGEIYQVSVAARRPVGVARYQWYKDGVIIEGATSSTLTIVPVELEDAGLYSCQISDDTPASSRTRSARLTVVKEMPAVSLTGLACLTALIALAASRRRRTD